ncbi:ATP-binding protein [Tepidibacter formicigenes]|jgi:hypothetical protein|uniref:ATP-binding protein n=1 Tax=Tepidibacter formicigenes DSM 15518 TaxID=1123349 RepID=A0A1M6R1R4_9FIRM|nr:ATP-binding protein [Tepidibacter formicigenes]SHK26297.1 hypothetical protein SAMN02744037_02004 [Tepidibacter formicigenes DSM 15518]
MIKDDKRIRIIIGHYGSGKTEFAMNYVMKMREELEGNIAISDLDVVNVYFRTREKRELLESKRIRVIDSSVKASAVDVPAVSAEVMAPIQDESYNYVMDVGGDFIGAKVVGRFSHLLKENEYDMFCVVNANRQETATVEGVLKHIEQIEEASNCKVTGLINNTHLVRETTVEDVLRGQELVKEVSKIKNIPIKYISCLEEIVKNLPQDIEGEILPIKMYMREDWM